MAGFLAAAFSLIDGFERFAYSFKMIMRDASGLIHHLLNLSGGFVSEAYAQMPGAVIPNTNVLPAFVYLVYVLLAVAYLSSPYAMFLSSDAKQQARGLEGL